VTDSASLAPLGSSPWRRTDRVGFLVTTAIGVVLVAVSWFGASDATSLGTQVRWVNAGVVGVIVLGAGTALWILAGRRAAGRLRRTIIASPELARRLAAPSERTDRKAAGVDAPVAVKGLTRYHRPECPLVADRPVVAASPRAHGRQGRRPCGVCLPDGATLVGVAVGE
jgi:hypothetical protein